MTFWSGAAAAFRWVRSLIRRANGRGGSSTLEFAVVTIPYIGLLLFVMEVAYDLFTQEVLDRSLYLAARQIQTGSAQNVLDGTDFITRYMAPNLTGLLSPVNIHVKVQLISPGAGQDYYDFTSGSLPMSNGSLDLTGFSSGGFCNAGPAQLLLISAIYVGPTMIGGLFSNVISESYNGSQVHATLSTIGFVSEAFSVATPSSGSASICA